MLVIENLSKELDSITKAHWIIKSDSTTYEYHFIPLGCDCGGVPEIGWEFDSVERALIVAIERAKYLNDIKYHWHANKKVRNKKVGR